MRVLLTGAAGFVGTAVGEVLEADGHEVVRVDLMLPQAHGDTRPPAGTHHVDVRDATSWLGLLRDVDAVCHQAAVVGAGAAVADLPEYAAAIDVYTDALGGERWLHVQEYAAPAEIPEAVTRRRFGELLAGAAEALEVPRERIATKTRARGKGGSKYGQLSHRGELLTVREGEARLKVNLFDYLDTGLFLDHRPLRLRIAREAQGGRFLNLFCYTGAATVRSPWSSWSRSRPPIPHVPTAFWIAASSLPAIVRTSISSISMRSE